MSVDSDGQQRRLPAPTSGSQEIIMFVIRAEAGAAGGVGCFDVGSFCEGAGCRSTGPNGVISLEATSGGEASTCLRAFCSTESGY